MIPEPHPHTHPNPAAHPPRRDLSVHFQQLRARTAWMTRANRTPRKAKSLQMVLRDWHKRIGLFAFLFMGWLGVSGFLINQSAAWGYDTTRIDWTWVTSLYGLHADPPRMGFAAGGRWLAVTSDYTLLDARPLKQRIASPLGVVMGGTAQRPLLFVATDSSLILLKTDGERYDELRSPVLPISTIRRIGTTDDGGVAIQDLDAYASTDSGDNWTVVDPARVHWSLPAPIPDPERSRLRPFSHPSVSLEHVLVDMHSGRLFGSFGVWLINLVGMSALGLAISGVWMWWRVQRNRRAAGR